LIFNWPNVRKPEAMPIPGNVLSGISISDNSSGKRINAPLASSLGQRVASQSNQRGSMSYITGSHAFKGGFTTQEAWHYGAYDQAGPAPGIGPGLVAYTFLAGKPSSLTQFAEPIVFRERLKVNLGAYVQDQWTINRLTLNLGLRYDYFNAYVPPQNLDAGPFVPARSYDIGGVRPGGRRPDGGQGELRTIRRGRHLHPGARQQSGRQSGVEREPHLDRSQRELRSGLRSHEPAGAKPLDDRQHRHVRHHQQPPVRQEQSEQHHL
jgi:hypothetical protein